MIKVIGGSGFVGSFLIEEISIIGNILNKNDLNFERNTSTVVLLAAEHRDDVSPTSLYYDVNEQGTKNVLDAMDKSNIKNLIFTSSVAIYGLNKSNPNESNPEDPFNHYGKSKWKAEQVIKKWYLNNPEEKSITIIRPTVIFGERNRGNVYNLLKQISSGKFLMIGKGDNAKSMAYVRNITAFIKKCIDKKELGFHIYNYADKPDFSMNELSAIIQQKMNIKFPKYKIPYWIGMLGGYGFDFLSLISGKKTSISSVRVKKFCATTQFDSSKAHKVFNAPFSLKEGLDKTLEHEFLNTANDSVLFYSE